MKSFMKENFKWIDRVSDVERYFLNPVKIKENEDGTITIPDVSNKSLANLNKILLKIFTKLLANLSSTSSKTKFTI